MKTSSSKEYFLMKFSASCVGRVNTLFTNSILPELMGKWFSRPPTPTAALDNCQKDERYCYCRGPDIEDMVGCDNAECSYKWFLLSCLKVTNISEVKHLVLSRMLQDEKAKTYKTSP